MKNIIIVDVDTDRSPVVQLGKTSAESLPQNKEEAASLVDMDMACLCEALSTLIQAADYSGFKSREESLKTCITHLERSLAKPIEPKITKIEEIRPNDSETES